MALLFMDGFEGYADSSELLFLGSTNLVRYTDVTGPTKVTFSSTTYRTTQSTAANSRSVYMSGKGIGTAGSFNLSVPPLTELILGFGCRFDNSAYANPRTFFALGGSSTGSSQGIVLSMNSSSGVIGIYTNSSGNPGTLLGTASGTYSNGIWYFIEMRVKLGSATGEVEMRIDGSEVANLTGVNTATGSITSYQTVSFTGTYSSHAWYMDDLYVCDLTGSVNNSFLGPISVYSLVPTGDGSATQMTPTGAANNWEAVDEVTQDGATTYVETNTTGNKDYYNFQSLPAGVTTINGVLVKAVNTTVDNGGRKVKLNIKNTADIISSTLRNLSLGSWVWDYFLSETAPDGSGWTATAVNSSEAGIEAAE